MWLCRLAPCWRERLIIIYSGYCRLWLENKEEEAKDMSLVVRKDVALLTEQLRPPWFLLVTHLACMRWMQVSLWSSKSWIHWRSIPRKVSLRSIYAMVERMTHLPLSSEKVTVFLRRWVPDTMRLWCCVPTLLLQLCLLKQLLLV